jgi:hypothetical protein
MKTKTVTRTAEDTIKSTTLDVDTTDTENTSSKLGILTPTLESMQAMTPYQRSCDKRSKLKKQTIHTNS